MSKTKVLISKVQLVNLNDDSKISILGESVVGRTEGQLNFPDDTLLSRKHLRILPTDEVVLVEDLGSTNKTAINHKKILPNKLYRIRTRDILEFGKQKFQVIIGGQVTEPGHDLKDSEDKIVKVNSQTKGPSGSKLDLQKFSDLKFEDDLNVMQAAAIEEDSFIPELAKLIKNKNAKYFVQFEGSEFGPLVLRELESVIGSQKFQGGAVLFWSEGLSNWLPVGALLRIMGLKNGEITHTKKLPSSFSLVASVNVYLDEQKSKKVMGTCQSVSLIDIAVAMAEDMSGMTGSIFIEVYPLKSSGVEKFSAEVKIKSKEFGGYLMEFTKLPDKAKAQLEKYGLRVGGPKRL